MATAFSIDLRELDVELAKTKATVDAWAKHKTDSFCNARDAHFQSMQDQSGEWLKRWSGRKRGCKLASLHD
jgi:hypothetical protein